LGAPPLLWALIHKHQAGTCCDAINRCHDSSGKFSKFLSDQLKGYKNQDPSTWPQKILTPSVLQELCHNKDGPLNRATQKLAGRVSFFAMCSCEYLPVPGECRTKRLHLGNLKFMFGTPDGPFLALLDTITITITFEFQMNNKWGKTIVMHCSGNPLPCPIHAWAALIIYILSYPDNSANTFLNAYITLQAANLVSLPGIECELAFASLLVALAPIFLDVNLLTLAATPIHSGSAMAMCSLPTFPPSPSCSLVTEAATPFFTTSIAQSNNLVLVPP
jgi:hypothetical protein